MKPRRRHLHPALWLGAAAAAVALVLSLPRVLAPAEPPSASQPAPDGPVRGDPAALRGLGHIAFVARGGVYVLDASGLHTVAASGAGSPGSAGWDPAGPALSLSRDGKWLAYRLGQGAAEASLWIAPTGGGAPRRVPGGGAGGFAWSPAADLLAVAQASGGLLVVAPGGRRQEILLHGERVGHFAWSPDGRLLAFSASSPGTALDSLYTAAPDGSGARRIPVDLPGAGGGLWPAGWWPNGGGLLLWLDPDHSMSIAADGLPLYSLPLGGGRPLRLTTTLPYADWISWEPGGQYFMAVTGGGRAVWNAKSLSRCNALQGGCAPVPQPAGTVALDPAWSPAGRRVAFVQAGGRGGAAGWVSCASPADCRDPAVTQATARRVLQGWLATRSLQLLDPGRGTALRVARAGSGISAPMWSSDGRFLLYEAGNALWLLGARGGGPRRVAYPLLSDYAPFGYYGRVNWAGAVDWRP